MISAQERKMSNKIRNARIMMMKIMDFKPNKLNKEMSFARVKHGHAPIQCGTTDIWSMNYFLQPLGCLVVRFGCLVCSGIDVLEVDDDDDDGVCRLFLSSSGHGLLLPRLAFFISKIIILFFFCSFVIFSQFKFTP